VSGYSVVDVNELPGEGPGGVVRKLRRELGATAFGFNHFRLPAGATGNEHHEAEDRQEEVYVVLAGSGVMRIDGEEVELRPGIVLRVDPEATRVPTAGDEGLEFVAFGAPLDKPYIPPDWG
jgi:mannose-6-phosphate isomerase-like protein (cupin superfamily)